MGERISFFLGEPGIVDVGFRIFDVDFLMGDVQVSRIDNRFFRGQFAEVFEQIFFILKTEIQAF